MTACDGPAACSLLDVFDVLDRDGDDGMLNVLDMQHQTSAVWFGNQEGREWYQQAKLDVLDGDGVLNVPDMLDRQRRSSRRHAERTRRRPTACSTCAGTAPDDVLDGVDSVRPSARRTRQRRRPVCRVVNDNSIINDTIIIIINYRSLSIEIIMITV